MQYESGPSTQQSRSLRLHCSDPQDTLPGVPALPAASSGSSCPATGVLFTRAAGSGPTDGLDEGVPVAQTRLHSRRKGRAFKQASTLGAKPTTVHPRRVFGQADAMARDSEAGADLGTAYFGDQRAPRCSASATG